uniref:Uncharacterized protein n=1 Tax=Wuchereria bancrofti TaxID=6293 RepID=A0AAF5PKB0_WUCBA
MCTAMLAVTAAAVIATFVYCHIKEANGHSRKSPAN